MLKSKLIGLAVPLGLIVSRSFGAPVGNSHLPTNYKLIYTTYGAGNSGELRYEIEENQNWLRLNSSGAGTNLSETFFDGHYMVNMGDHICILNDTFSFPFYSHPLLPFDFRNAKVFYSKAEITSFPGKGKRTTMQATSAENHLLNDNCKDIAWLPLKEVATPDTISEAIVLQLKGEDIHLMKATYRDFNEWNVPRTIEFERNMGLAVNYKLRLLKSEDEQTTLPIYNWETIIAKGTLIQCCVESTRFAFVFGEFPGTLEQQIRLHLLNARTYPQNPMPVKQHETTFARTLMYVFAGVLGCIAIVFLVQSYIGGKRK